MSICLQVLLLFIGAILTSLGVVCSNRAQVREFIDENGGGEFFGEEFSYEKGIRQLTLQLSLVQSFVAGQFSYMNPVMKWKQMKAAHQSLISEVWKYRTRTEKYAPVLGDVTYSERTLKDSILRIKQQIVDKSTITEVNQARHYPLNTFSHHQYADANQIRKFLEKAEKDKEEDEKRKEESEKPNQRAKKIETKIPIDDEPEHLETMINTNFQGHSKKPKDNEQSPVNPEAQIQLRLKPSMSFYQSRLPGYYRRRNVFQFLFLIGTALGGLLAFLQHTEWVALATIMTSSITAWMEFHGLESKISRQNSAVHGLDSINLRWQAKSEIERSRPYAINMLIIETENIMAGERNAWLSTQSSSKDKPKEPESDDKQSNN